MAFVGIAVLTGLYAQCMQWGVLPPWLPFPKIGIEAFTISSEYTILYVPHQPLLPHPPTFPSPLTLAHRSLLPPFMSCATVPVLSLLLVFRTKLSPIIPSFHPLTPSYPAFCLQLSPK
jgi:hypothetical protein